MRPSNGAHALYEPSPIGWCASFPGHTIAQVMPCSSSLRRSDRSDIPGRTYATRTRSIAKPPQYGQPTHATHPHLVKEGFLNPGFPASEYEDRRRKLMRSLPEGSVVVCMGGTVRYMSDRASGTTTADGKTS